MGNFFPSPKGEYNAAMKCIVCLAACLIGILAGCAGATTPVAQVPRPTSAVAQAEPSPVPPTPQPTAVPTEEPTAAPTGTPSPTTTPAPTGTPVPPTPTPDPFAEYAPVTI